MPNKNIMIDKEEFVGFVCHSESLLKDNTAALLTREFPHKRKKKEQAEQAKEASERRWDWDWDRFDKSFRRWWEQWAKGAGASSLSMKRGFIPFWISDKVSDEMRSGALRRVRWHETLKCATQLWKQYDISSSGWITVSDAKKLLGKIVSPDGHVLSTKTITEKKKGKPSHRMTSAIEKLLGFNNEEGDSGNTSSLVSEAAFSEYWSDTVMIAKEYTIKHMELENVWDKLGNGRGDLQPWQAKALLATIWGERQSTHAAQTACKLQSPPFSGQ